MHTLLKSGYTKTEFSEAEILLGQAGGRKKEKTAEYKNGTFTLHVFRTLNDHCLERIGSTERFAVT